MVWFVATETKQFQTFQQFQTINYLAEHEIIRSKSLRWIVNFPQQERKIALRFPTRLHRKDPAAFPHEWM